MLCKIIVIGSNQGSEFLFKHNNQTFDIISHPNNPRIVSLKKDDLDINMQINNLIFDNSSIVAEGIVVDNKTRAGGQAALRLSFGTSSSDIVDAEEVVVTV
jgi:hypothetical protein